MAMIEVTPIYGWGWVTGSETLLQVPEPFKLQINESDGNRWTGTIVADGHEFGGRTAILSRRHVEWDGHLNIRVEPDHPTGQASTGYGTVLELPSLDPT